MTQMEFSLDGDHTGSMISLQRKILFIVSTQEALIVQRNLEEVTPSMVRILIFHGSVLEQILDLMQFDLMNQL